MITRNIQYFILNVKLEIIKYKGSGPQINVEPKNIIGKSLITLQIELRGVKTLNF